MSRQIVRSHFASAQTCRQSGCCCPAGLTFIKNWVGHDGLEGESEGAGSFFSLKKHLEGQSDTVEVDILRIGFVGEPGCKDTKDQ